MVIQEEANMPIESMIRKPLGQKRYVMVNNHVRELLPDDHGISTNLSQSSKEPENILDSKLPTSTKSLESNNPSLANQGTVVCPLDHKKSEISESDLEELRKVYKKCKNVIRKIETKYGHLLNFTNTKSSSKRKLEESDSSEEQVSCQCKLNKKVIYDDDGNEMFIETTLNNHICVKKPKLDITCKNIINERLQVDYNDVEIDLPESLHELTKCLQNPNSEASYRNKVIEKIKSIRQEYMNEIRFRKRAIIETLKENPDELLDFKGTNLSTLSGYS